MISDEDTRLEPGLFVLYDLFPWLTAGLRGCVYYWQCLTVVAVLLVRTLSSHRWCLRVFQGNKCPPQIVAAWKQAAKKIISVASDLRDMVCTYVDCNKSVSASSVWLGLMSTLYNSQCFVCFIRTRVCYVWVAGRESKCPPVEVYGECAVTCKQDKVALSYDRNTLHFAVI